MHGNHLEGVLGHRWLSPISRVSDSVRLGHNSRILISNKFLSDAVLLTREPCSRSTAQQKEDEWGIVQGGKTTESRQDRGVLQ